MGSHILDILFQGIWASLTGGWFYDPQQLVFCNTFHLYLWVFLLALPLILYSTLEPSVVVWSIYCCMIGLLFGIIKIVNYRLHHLFDTGEAEEECPSGPPSGSGDTSGKGRGDLKENEYIEMTSMGTSPAGGDQPVPLSTVSSQLEMGKDYSNEPLPSPVALKAGKTDKAPLAEIEGYDIPAGQLGKVARLGSNSSGNDDEDSPDQDDDVPRMITTQAEIEHTPMSSSTADELQEHRAGVVNESETATQHVGGGEATDNRTVVWTMDGDDRVEGDSVIDKTAVESESDSLHRQNNTKEITSGDYTKNDVSKTIHSPVEKTEHNSTSDSDHGRPKLRMRKDRRAVRRSKSTAEWSPTAPKATNKAKVSSRSLNMPAHPNSRPSLQHPSTSSNSDWSDVSFGEVELPDGHDELFLSTTTHPLTSSSVGESSGSTLVAVSQQSQHDRRDSPHPNSVHSVPYRPHSRTSSSSSPLHPDSSRVVPYFNNMWLQRDPDADTDSLTSGGADTASHTTESSSSAMAEPDIGCVRPPKELDLTTPSSPSAEDLALMRSQGAIPKKIRSRSVCQSNSMKESTSPGSTDLSDPEELRRRLIEILWDPHQHTEELRQLQQFVKMKRNHSGTSETTSVKDKQNMPNAKPSMSKEDEKEAEKPTENLSNREEDRKTAVTPTECCALLPANPQLNRPSNRRARRRRGRRHVHQKRGSPPIAALNMMVGEEGHLATSHDDTTDGAVHWFQDEQGYWMSYTFGENSSGVALNLTDVNMNTSTNMGLERRRHHEPEKWSLSSIASNSTVIVEESPPPPAESPVIQRWLELDDMARRLEFPTGTLQSYVQSLLRRNHTSTSSTDSDLTHANTRSSRGAQKPKHFYKFWMWPMKHYIKIHFDRLSLLAALDRNISVIENVISVIMAVAVGALGALMISSSFYHDLCLLLFCFIMAGCQYSLLKSVQPDAASPMHGFNHLIVFSRPFYFCLCCSIVLLLDHGSHTEYHKPIYLYGIPFTISSALIFLGHFFKLFILSFPLLFTLGLLPQVNTFLMYMLEQIDMHIFGGNATTSLLTSFYCVCRSCFALVVLYGFAFASLKEIGGSNYKCGTRIDDAAQNVPFSILCGLMVTVAYHLSRSASDPGMLWVLLKGLVVRGSRKQQEKASSDTQELIDPLPEKLKNCLKQRLQSDAIVCIIVTILVFAVHVSTAFTSPALQPVLSDVLYLLAASVGFIVHYIIPQTRKEMPWLCCSHPLLRSKEWMYFEVKEAPKVIWIEGLYLGLRFFERNVICPVVCLCATTTSAPAIICKFGNYAGPLIILVCSLKMLRFAFSDTPRQYLIIAFTYFFFKYDFRWSSETFLIDYFFISILFCKFCDLMLKLNFIITYIAPWQITWGSAFHAFVQPFSVPHSAMLFLQAIVSAIFSTPLNPFLGSAIFFTSYVRPIKFWERDYNTKRVDHTNTRLASQLERNPGADDNNLNSIFYEHLTRSLQHSLCGDLLLGRWGNYTQGDCFIMASDYLNALVHIIEVGNGLVTFQLRGLEFRGTYCQQREVEAITEGVDENERFCCFEPGHLPHFLSLNAAFSQRWLAWEVVVSKYILEGYSISDNSAATMLQVFELRKALITYYIKSIIYYMVRSPRLEDWTENSTIHQALQALEDDGYVDLDPTFNLHIDEDFDSRLQGISRNSYCQVYLTWIQHCAHRRDKTVNSSKSSMLVTLCYALSLLGRRALSAASHNSASVDFFLFGLHALFKGDFRIQSQRDEWVFADMDMMRRVVAPAVRMSLKLHQDHFTSPDEYDDCQVLYDAITEHENTMVISHEADPAWRNAVLSNVPSLLALRHVFDEGSDEYKIIMLNKRYLSFRVVKVNRECVRGLWAGQQQELIFLRNRNPERGSIQNAKQALRNMINSSCDQPIGYPIYVSPLTTSYSTTHDQLVSIPVIGGEFRFSAIHCFFRSLWNRLRQRCDATCAGGSASFELDLPYTVSHQMAAATIGSTPRLTVNSPQQIEIPLQQLGNRGSLISTASSASKANALAPLANLTNFISESSFRDNLPHRVTIMDTSLVYDSINVAKKADVLWPNDDWRAAGGKNGWKEWAPRKGMEGTVVHRWTPGNSDPTKRSHTDKTIVLVQLKEHFVPIAENGVLDLGAEV